MLRIGLCVALALALTSSTRASAQARTAVLGVEAVDGATEAAARLADALRAQVRQSTAFRLSAGKSLEEIKLVFGCVDEKPDCMARAGRNMGVSKLIWGALRKAPGGFNFTVKLLDVLSAKVERVVSENLSAADVAGAAARRTVERVTGGFIPSAGGTVRITCNVAGASVRVGDRDLGVSEGTVSVENLAPGQHLVRVSKEGYRPWRQKVTVVSGETTMIEATLEAEKSDLPPATRPGPDPEPDRRTGWKVAFWISAAATVGFGAGIVGTGMQVLTAQDDKNRAVGAYHTNVGRDHFTETSEDVCAENEKVGDTGIQSACDKGTKFRNLTNAFIGITAAAAIVTGVFYYKAYIAKPEQPSRTEEASTRRRDQAVEWVVAPAIGPQGGGLDFHLRF